MVSENSFFFSSFASWGNYLIKCPVLVFFWNHRIYIVGHLSITTFLFEKKKWQRKGVLSEVRYRILLHYNYNTVRKAMTKKLSPIYFHTETLDSFGTFPINGVFHLWTKQHQWFPHFIRHGQFMHHNHVRKYCELSWH